METATTPRPQKPPKSRKSSRPDGVWKLGVLWKNNPRMMYYRSTRKQDLQGHGGKTLIEKILSRRNAYPNASYAALYYADMLRVEWKDHDGQWVTPAKKAKPQKQPASE